MLSGIEPGKLDVLLIFQSAVKTRNDINEQVTTWTDYGKKFGKRIWKDSPERFEAKQQVGTEDVVFMVRFDESLNDTMRFRQHLDEHYFYIRNVQNWRREGYSLITAERRDNQGDDE